MGWQSAGRDGMSIRVRAAFRVASRPRAHIHSLDGVFISTSGEGMTAEQDSQSFGVDPPSIQGRIEAGPAAAMWSLEA
jgi:hypothetical protein